MGAQLGELVLQVALEAHLLVVPLGDELEHGHEVEGLEVAAFLVDCGRKVTVVESGPEENLGLNIPPQLKPKQICYCQTHGVRMLMGVTYDRITDEGLIVTHGSGITETLEADNIVLELPVQEDLSLYDKLKGSAKEVYAIGSCTNPGLIVNAIADAYEVTRNI